jgi:ParB family chromosome partitioning protein
MNIHDRGLGRGLSSLLNAASSQTHDETSKLAISQIIPGKTQPRKYFNDQALSELAASIKQQGIIQPLLVRLLSGSPQRYEIIAGERRWRAAKIAGLTEVPVIIAEYTDKEAMTIALVENLQREDLNPMEEAEAFQTIRDTYGLSQEVLAEQLGKSRSAVSNAIRLLQLPQLLKDGLFSGIISAGHARALLSIPDTSIQEQFYGVICSQHLSVREVESAVAYYKASGHLPEKFIQQNSKEKTLAKTKKIKPESLRMLQKQLRKLMGIRLTFCGNEQKGRIQISYDSAEEFSNILKQLGIDEYQKQ